MSNASEVIRKLNKEAQEELDKLNAELDQIRIDLSKLVVDANANENSTQAIQEDAAQKWNQLLKKQRGIRMKQHRQKETVTDLLRMHINILMVCTHLFIAFLTFMHKY